MFKLTKTFTHTTGFSITPIEMQGVGFIFLPKELEAQLGYDNLSNTIRQSESFSEGIEYLVLENSNLLKLKEFLNRRNTIASVYDLKHIRSLIVFTEAGLYTVMFLSRKPDAQTFRRWVTGEVLPSIRKTGMYKLSETIPSTPNVSELFDEIATIRNILFEQQQTITRLAQMLARQDQFQQYALRGFDRIESVLAELPPHDMFSGWSKIKGLVDDVTKIYDLSDVQRKQYLRELCQAHQVPLPEKSLLESESLFHDASEIAAQMGLYSTNNKPHCRLVVALIRHLHLTQDKYSRTFPLVRRGYSTTVLKYSADVIPHLLEWLEDKDYPEMINLACGEEQKMRKFKVKYRLKRQK